MTNCLGRPKAILLAWTISGLGLVACGGPQVNVPAFFETVPDLYFEAEATGSEAVYGSVSVIKPFEISRTPLYAAVVDSMKYGLESVDYGGIEASRGQAEEAGIPFREFTLRALVASARPQENLEYLHAPISAEWLAREAAEELRSRASRRTGAAPLLDDLQVGFEVKRHLVEGRELWTLESGSALGESQPLTERSELRAFAVVGEGVMRGARPAVERTIAAEQGRISSLAENPAFRRAFDLVDDDASEYEVTWSETRLRQHWEKLSNRLDGGAKLSEYGDDLEALCAERFWGEDLSSVVRLAFARDSRATEVLELLERRENLWLAYTSVYVSKLVGEDLAHRRGVAAKRLFEGVTVSRAGEIVEIRLEATSEALNTPLGDAS